MASHKTNQDYFFDYLKRLEEDQLLDEKIDEKLLPYMKEQQDFSKIKEDLRQELRLSLLRELRPEIYKIVRECINETTLNIKII